MSHEQTVKLHDHLFRLIIPYSRLEKAIGEVASRINSDYNDKERPLFIGVLNGSFMFMSELLKNIEFECEVSFIKIASYNGIANSQNISELIGLTSELRGRHVIIVEDIVDTGHSIDHLLRSVSALGPASIAVATLILKPDVYDKKHKIDYCAIEVPDKFIVGFGMDYDQLGRNLKGIYEIADE